MYNKIKANALNRRRAMTKTGNNEINTMKTFLMNRRWMRKQLHALSFLMAICGMILLVGILLGTLLKV